jgi:hypothetical protein
MHWLFPKKKEKEKDKEKEKEKEKVIEPKPIPRPRSRYTRRVTPRPAPKTKPTTLARPKPRPLTRKLTYGNPTSQFNRQLLNSQLNRMKNSTNRLRQAQENKNFMQRFVQTGFPKPRKQNPNKV